MSFQYFFYLRIVFSLGGATELMFLTLMFDFAPPPLLLATLHLCLGIKKNTALKCVFDK
jgi:hypothetical protein